MKFEVPSDSKGIQAKFKRDGFVAIESFLDYMEVVEFRKNIDRFISSVVPGMPREHIFLEDLENPESLKQLQRLFAYDDFFHGWMFGSPFEDLARDLLQDEVVGVNMQFFNKPPGMGKPTPAHQDGFYFMLDPNEAVTMWLALDEVDEETGCLRYLPESHRHGLRPHLPSGTLGFSQGLADFSPADQAREIAVVVKPGDLIVHHALTVHRADGNRSETRTRRAIGWIYYAAHAKESNQKAVRQARLEAELRQSGKI